MPGTAGRPTEGIADYPAETFGQADVDADSERTIARIWRITLDRITETEPAAVDLLRTLAWYAPESIPLTRSHEPGLDPPKRSTALGPPAAYNMITPDRATGTLSIHRLVQAVARTRDLSDPHRHPDVIADARSRAVETLHAALPDHEDPGRWPVRRTLLPHIDAVTSHHQRFGHRLRWARDRGDPQPGRAVSVRARPAHQ
ncbi:hypothetical protein [Nocardia sp. NPDC003963]